MSANQRLYVELSASVAGFNRDMGKATQSVGHLEKTVARTSKNVDQDMKRLGGLSMATGALLAGGFLLASKATMDFEKTMSGVRAVSNASAAQMRQLSAAALKAGKDTAFSASEAAQAEAELAKAGVSTRDILQGGLRGALGLAAAGQLELADAATLAAQAMNIFKLGGDDVTHIADVLAAGANKSAADVGQLGAALRQGGLLAAQTGLSLEDTVGALSAFADNALIGSDAGTSLKTMLQRLTPQSDEAAGMMKTLGLSAYDAQGQFVGLEAFAGQLQHSFAKLTPEARNSAMGVIFGSDAVRAANILYEQGAAGVHAYTEAVNDNGAAGRMAAIQMDNLAGDLEQLKGSLETALIGSGSKATGVLRGMTQATNAAIGAFIDMPAPVQTAVTAVAGIGGAAALAGGAALVLIPKVVALDASLKTLTGGAIGARAAISGLGVAGAIAGGVAAYVIGIDQLSKALADNAPGVNALTGSLLSFLQTGEATGDLLNIVGDDFERLSGTIQHANQNKYLGMSLNGPQGIESDRRELEALDAALAGLVAGGQADAAARLFEKIRHSAVGISDAQLAKWFNDYTEAAAGAANQSHLASGAIDGVAGSERGLVPETEAATKALQDQADHLRAAYDPVFAMRKAVKDHAEAQAAAAKAVHDHGKASTQAKVAQWALLEATVGLEGAALGLKAGMESGAVGTAKSTEQLRAWHKAGLITDDQMKSLGVEIEKTTKRAQTLAATPAAPKIPIPRDLPMINGMLDGLLAKLDRLDGKTVTTTVVVNGVNTLAGAAAKLAIIDRGRAAGSREPEGLIRGAGTDTSDNLIFALSPGEFVVNARATRRNLPALRAMNGLASGSAFPVSFSPPLGSLSQQASRVRSGGGSADDLRSLLASYDEYLHKLDQAAQRERLLGDVREAQTARAKASVKERAAAQQQLNDATKALREFDQAAVVEQQKAAVDRLITSLEGQAQLQEEAAQKAAERAAEQVAAFNNMYDVGARTAQDQIAWLTKRMAAEKQYSDEWTALWRQREQVLGDVADAQQKAVDAAERAAADIKDAYDKAVGVRDDALSHLNDLLAQEATIHGRQRDAEQKYAQSVANIHARQVQAEAAYYTQVAAAGQQFNTEQGRILAGRTQQLQDWARIDEITTVSWGNTVARLVDNARDQLGQFDEWQDALADARRSGVSDAVIAALGLDEGPKALGQLRQFSTATLDEIDALNQAVASRTSAAAAQVATEQAAGFGQLGRDLTAASEQYTGVLLTIHQTYNEDQAKLQDELTQAQADLMDEQAKAAEDLAAIGKQQGLSYGDALAAAMLSRVPAIQAAAAALQAAAAGVPTAAAASSVSATPTPTAAAAAAAASNPLDPATIAATAEQLWTVAQRDIADRLSITGIRSATYDQGGILQPGYTLAFNGTGRPERVTTGGAGPAQITVNVNAPVFGVDDLQRTIVSAIDSTLISRRTAAQIAGVMS
jgi:TP901 family phage tail tape measure protein